MTPQEISKILEELAAILGPIAETVWDIHVRQFYIGVTLEFGLGLVLFLISMACLGLGLWARKSHMRKQKRREDTLVEEISMAVATALGVFCFLFCWVPLASILRLLNPEYYIIQLLLGH